MPSSVLGTGSIIVKNTGCLPVRGLLVELET